MKQDIENFHYFKDEMIEQFYRKITNINQLLKEKELCNRINQIIDIKDYTDDILICTSIGYMESSEEREAILCYEDEEVKFHILCDGEIMSDTSISDLIYFDKDGCIFENLNFELDNIIENANKGQLYINYK